MMRRLVIGALAVSLITPLAVGLFHRQAYGTWAWWRAPRNISWCGRTYHRGIGPTVTRAMIESQSVSLPGDAPYPLATVTRIPPAVGRPVLAQPIPAARRRDLGLPCAMVVYLETGDDRYTGYELVGGP
ncbi:MAG: hypothetical protein GXX79_18090 [Actinomycetales bacterium]|nr:hypothetical protein [Actinomycetales bacterium]